jgi:hypothetical protein
VDIAVDDDGDLVVDGMGDFALAPCEDAIFVNVREAVTTELYRWVGASFFGNDLFRFTNSPEDKATRRKITAAARYPLLYNGLVDETSIRTSWLDDGSGVAEFKTIAGTAPKRLKFVEP